MVLRDHNLGSEGADQSRLSIKSQTKVVLIDTLTTHADAKYYGFLLRFTNLNSPFPFSKAESPGLGDSESCPLSLHQSMNRGPQNKMVTRKAAQPFRGFALVSAILFLWPSSMSSNDWC